MGHTHGPMCKGIHASEPAAGLQQKGPNALMPTPSWVGASKRPTPRRASSASLPPISDSAKQPIHPTAPSTPPSSVSKEFKPRRLSLPDPPTIKLRRNSAPVATPYAPQLPPISRTPQAKGAAQANGVPFPSRTYKRSRRSDSCEKNDAVAATSKISIPRKIFQGVLELFREQDSDGDGLIKKEEFVKAVCRLQQVDDRLHKAQPTMGQSLSRHAGDMYFPYLSRKEIARAVHHYTYTPAPPPQKPPTLEDVEGATEEIEAMFNVLDTDNDGIVRVASLAPLCERTGIRHNEIQEWLADLGQEECAPHLQRLKSKLDLKDFSSLLAPIYIASLAAGNNKFESTKEIQQRIEWNQELNLQLPVKQ